MAPCIEYRMIRPMETSTLETESQNQRRQTLLDLSRECSSQKTQEILLQIRSLLTDDVMAYSAREVHSSLRITAIERKASDAALLAAAFEVASFESKIRGIQPTKETQQYIAALNHLCDCILRVCAGEPEELSVPVTEEIATVTLLQNPEIAPEGAELVSDLGLKNVSRIFSEKGLQLLQYAKANSEELRLNIIQALREHKTLSVTDLCDVVGKRMTPEGMPCSQPSISFHLGKLLKMHYVRFTRDGRHRNYRLTDNFYKDEQLWKLVVFSIVKNDAPEQEKYFLPPMTEEFHD